MYNCLRCWLCIAETGVKFVFLPKCDAPGTTREISIRKQLRKNAYWVKTNVSLLPQAISRKTRTHKKNMNKNITQNGKTQITLSTVMVHNSLAHHWALCRLLLICTKTILRRCNNKKVHHDFQLTDTSDTPSKEKKKKLNKARLLKRIPHWHIDTYTRITTIKIVRQCKCLKTHVRLKRTLQQGSLEQLLLGSSWNPRFKCAPNTKHIVGLSKEQWLYKMEMLHTAEIR